MGGGGGGGEVGAGGGGGGKEPQQVGTVLRVGPLSHRRCQLTRHWAVMHSPSP